MMIRLTELIEWQGLLTHQKLVATQSMQTYFAEDSSRFERFSLQIGDIFLDYSKNRITSKTMQLLCNLANALHLSDKIEGLFTGAFLNSTEQRPALHTALRNRSNAPVYVNGKNIMLDIQAALEKMHEFTEQIRHQIWRGSTGQPIRDIVNVGIGGVSSRTSDGNPCNA